MAKPSDKHPDIEALLSSVFQVNRRESIENNTCVRCKQVAWLFDTELSKKEYTISGLCQQCQDVIFRNDEQDDEAWHPGEIIEDEGDE